MSKNRVIDLPPSMRPEMTGPRLIAAREALELSQSEIADMLSTDRSAWSKYERGLRPLPDHLAFKISERFGVTMDFLYRGRLEGMTEPLRGKIFLRIAAARTTS